MPPFTSWFKGAKNIGWLIGHECPGGAHDMPMLRDPGQRAAGVRPLHAHAGRRLRAVPAPGARARRRPGPARHGVLRPRSVRDVRAAGAAARRPRARRRARGDDDARRLRRAARTGPSPTPAHQLPTVRDDLLDRPTPCDGWRLADLLAHMEDALDAFTEAAGGAGRGAPSPGARPRAGSTAIQVKACALLGAWSRPGPGDVLGRRARPGQPAAGRRPPRSRSPCTAGTSAGRPAPAPDPRGAGRGAAARSRDVAVTPADRGRPVRGTRARLPRTPPDDQSACSPSSAGPDWSTRQFPAISARGARSVPRLGTMPSPQASHRSRRPRSGATLDDSPSELLGRGSATTPGRRHRRRARRPRPSARAAPSDELDDARAGPAAGHAASTAGWPAASSARPATLGERLDPACATCPGWPARPRTTAAASWPRPANEVERGGRPLRPDPDAARTPPTTTRTCSRGAPPPRSPRYGSAAGPRAPRSPVSTSPWPGLAGAPYAVALGLRDPGHRRRRTPTGPSLLRQARDELDDVPAARLVAQIEHRPRRAAAADRRPGDHGRGAGAAARRGDRTPATRASGRCSAGSAGCSPGWASPRGRCSARPWRR